MWAGVGSAALAACLPAAAPPAQAPLPPIQAQVALAPAETAVVEETASSTPAVDPEPAEGTAPGTPYDCRGIRPAKLRFPRPSDAVTADIVAAVHPENPGALTPSPALSSTLARAEALDPAAVSTFDRIVIQNTALAAALRLGDGGADVQAALRVVRRFALPAAELEEMGAAPWTSLDLWIGPRDAWVDRKGESCGDGRLLMHDNVFSGTRAFRPMRVGGRRALVSQLVAIDTEGHPHVTPAVGQIELRRGLSSGSAACVIEIDAEALRDGDAGGLRPLAFDELVQTKFVHRAGEAHVGCIGCHTGQGIGDFDDVPAAEADLLRSNRRTAALHRLARAMAPLVGISSP
jgi:hypothetical protein